MKTRLPAVLAGLVGLLAAGLVAMAASAASATAPQPDPVCATWTMRGGSTVGEVWTWGGAPDGSSISRYSAKLVKPAGQNPGVEFAAFNLDVQAPADDELLVGVNYATHDGATTVAGAIRLFGYKDQGADTVNDAPDYGPAIAGTETGHLVLTIPAGQKLGTLGVVFDASNSSTGSVRFSQMKIDNRPVWFTPCPEPEPTATPTPTQTATPTPSVGPTPGGTATPGPTGSAVPVPAGLPVTGSGTAALAATGALVLVAGAALILISRRRRVKFES